MSNKRDTPVFRREHLELEKLTEYLNMAREIKSDLLNAYSKYKILRMQIRTLYGYKHDDLVNTQRKIAEFHLYFAGAIHTSFAIDEINTVIAQLSSAEEAYKQVVITMKEQNHD